jgi:hypothetical protein
LFGFLEVALLILHDDGCPLFRDRKRKSRDNAPAKKFLTSFN